MVKRVLKKVHPVLIFLWRFVKLDVFSSHQVQFYLSTCYSELGIYFMQPHSNFELLFKFLSLAIWFVFLHRSKIIFQYFLYCSTTCKPIFDTFLLNIFHLRYCLQFEISISITPSRYLNNFSIFRLLIVLFYHHKIIISLGTYFSGPIRMLQKMRLFICEIMTELIQLFRRTQSNRTKNTYANPIDDL